MGWTERTSQSQALRMGARASSQKERRTALPVQVQVHATRGGTAVPWQHVALLLLGLAASPRAISSELGTVGPLLPSRVLSWRPRIFHFPQAMPHALCDALVEQSRHNMRLSGVGTDENELQTNVRMRNSSSSFLPAAQDMQLAVRQLKNTLGSFMSVPPEQFERLQVGLAARAPPCQRYSVPGARR